MAPCRNATAPSTTERIDRPESRIRSRTEDCFYLSWFPTLQETSRTSPQDAIRVGVAGGS